MTVDDCVKDIFVNKIPLEDKYIYLGRFVRGQEYKLIMQSYPGIRYGSAILFSYGIGGIITYTEGENVIYKYATDWTVTRI